MHAAHDQGFVAADPAAVYAALSDLSAYPRWWLDARADGPLAIRLGGRWHRVEPSDLRPGIGLVLHLQGSFPGTLEWHLQPEDDGTIVNAILNIEPPGGRRRGERRLLRCRATVHRGLVGLKGALE